MIYARFYVWELSQINFGWLGGQKKLTFTTVKAETVRVEVLGEGHNFFAKSPLDLSYVVTVKSTVKILQNFVAFSECMNFTWSKNGQKSKNNL